MKSLFCFIIIALLAAPLAFADDDHHHLEPGEKLGTVSFPTSCAAGQQKAFERGVALLHSFVYDEAKDQFARIAQQDPHCAIAYWGQAMSLYHQLWSRPTDDDFKQGWELIQKGEATKAATKRERGYIEALGAFYEPGVSAYENRTAAYAEGMKRVYETYPSDHEAAVFYALSLLASGNNDDAEIANKKQAIAILNKLFDQEPNHPGVAHYLIHACDNPNFAQQGLAAARVYAGIAPSSPHALHMPSHIFTRLGLWQDDIQSNLAAIAAAQKISPDFHHMMHHRIHSMDFLEYAYLQIGDDAKAQTLVDEVAGMKREDMDPEFVSYLDGMLADFPARYGLERRQWKDVLALQPPAGVKPYSEAITYWAQAIAAGHLHNADAARKAVDQYDAMVEATKKSDKPYYVDGMKTDTQEAHAWLAFAEGKNDEALGLLREVSERQDKVGKAEVALPAREMLADMLLELGRPKEALTEYEQSLRTDPNRFNGLYGAARAAELTQQPQRAARYYSQLLKNCANSNSDRPELAKAKELVASAN